MVNFERTNKGYNNFVLKIEGITLSNAHTEKDAISWAKEHTKRTGVTVYVYEYLGRTKED